MKKFCFIIISCSLLIISSKLSAQVKWINVDSLYQPLPSSVHIYFTDTPVDTGKFRAYYLIADLKDKHLEFIADTSKDRRLTPVKFYEKNDKPLVVVNTTFFSYETNRSLNAVIKDGHLVAYNSNTVYGRGKDTFTYRHVFGSALGISKKRKADIAWLYTDSTEKYAYASQDIIQPIKDSVIHYDLRAIKKMTTSSKGLLQKWKMKTAVGGGPVLIHEGNILVANNEEIRFAGKAINDKHPRTAMGYTKDDKLIILMIEGRNKNAGGATLGQEAQLFKDLGCWEALNLDGGGSSCLLVNGKETIKISDAAGQRPVPSVFIIRNKK